MSLHLKRIARLGTLVAAVGQVACQSLSDGAKETFSKSFTCPIDRVEVRARPELHPSDWFKPRKPPTDIAADPERLKMWQAEQDKLRTVWDPYHSIYEARGCGHQSLFECGKAGRGSSRSWSCSERTYPPGVAQW